LLAEGARPAHPEGERPKGPGWSSAFHASQPPAPPGHQSRTDLSQPLTQPLPAGEETGWRFAQRIWRRSQRAGARTSVRFRDRRLQPPCAREARDGSV